MPSLQVIRVIVGLYTNVNSEHTVPHVRTSRENTPDMPQGPKRNVAEANELLKARLAAHPELRGHGNMLVTGSCRGVLRPDGSAYNASQEPTLLWTGKL